MLGVDNHVCEVQVAPREHCACPLSACIFHEGGREGWRESDLHGERNGGQWEGRTGARESLVSPLSRAHSKHRRWR